MTLDYARVKIDDGPAGWRREVRRRFMIRAMWYVCAFAMFALVAAVVLLPAFGMRNRGLRAATPQCMSNLRQIGSALMMYTNNSRGRVPDSMDTLVSRTKCLQSPYLLECPAVAKRSTTRPSTTLPRARTSYVYCGEGFVYGKTKSAEKYVVVYEPLANHCGTGCNVLYADGHVVWVGQPAAGKMIADVRAGVNPPRMK